MHARGCGLRALDRQVPDRHDGARAPASRRADLIRGDPVHGDRCLAEAVDARRGPRSPADDASDESDPGRRLVLARVETTTHDERLACARACDVQKAQLLLFVLPRIISRERHVRTRTERLSFFRRDARYADRERRRIAPRHEGARYVRFPGRSEVSDRDDGELEPLGCMDAHDADGVDGTHLGCDPLITTPRALVDVPEERPEPHGLALLEALRGAHQTHDVRPGALAFGSPAPQDEVVAERLARQYDEAPDPPGATTPTSPLDEVPEGVQGGPVIVVDGSDALADGVPQRALASRGAAQGVQRRVAQADHRRGERAQERLVITRVVDDAQHVQHVLHLGCGEEWFAGCYADVESSSA